MMSFGSKTTSGCRFWATRKATRRRHSGGLFFSLAVKLVIAKAYSIAKADRFLGIHDTQRRSPALVNFRPAVVEVIEVFYNTRRRRSSSEYASPAEYEPTEKA
jgi:hypothetical protein